MMHAPHSPKSSDMRNLVFALVIASIVMVAWQHFYEQPRIEAQRAARAAAEESLKAAEATRLKGQITHADGVVVPGSLAVAQVKAKPEKAAPRVAIESDALAGSVSLKGAQFDDILLKKYRQTQSEDSDAVHLLNPKHAGDERPPYSANFGLLSADSTLDLPGKNTLWHLQSAGQKTLTPDTPLVLTYQNKQGLRFTKTIALDTRYMFTVTLEAENKSGKAVVLYPYGLINRVVTEEDKKLALLHEGPIGVSNEKLSHVAYDALREDGNVEYHSKGGWLGITDKYWLTALIPAQSSMVDMTLRHIQNAEQPTYQVDMRGAGVQLEPGASHQFITRFYAGAKKVGVLDHYRKLLDVPLFDRAVDFGALYFLTKPIFHVLSFFNKLVGNFGVSIILLTICIRLLMFPLANKSFTSMSQMKLLAPKMKEIREKYQGDPMKMNTEIMQMYKREKVNPVSGCLPILLQLPVFFALYKVLFVTLEMRHAPFFGWVTDLSAPDPTSIINLFGLLPFTVDGLPNWINIGVWPLIMCATMVLQQKLNPKPNDEIQAMLMGWMPYVFLFMFASFPAGLVVYWAVNNTLSIAQQWVIQRRIQAKAGKKSRD